MEPCGTPAVRCLITVNFQILIAFPYQSPLEKAFIKKNNVKVIILFISCRLLVEKRFHVCLL